jgi:hypothetical protein
VSKGGEGHRSGKHVPEHLAGTAGGSPKSLHEGIQKSVVEA